MVDEKSRYKTAGKAYTNQISADQVPELVDSLRKAFRSEKTYSYEWRISQLKALRRMLTEREKDLAEALYGDLKKSPVEGFFTEIATTIGEVDYAMENLKEWMKPESKGNSIATVPSWSQTQRDPLGVIMVFGSWNYPVYLSINPIVGAVAAGNCVLLKPGSYAANSSHVMNDLITQYMDPECIRVVEGNRDVTSALLAQRFDKIFFTGSGFVGKIVARAAAEHLTPCVLELGGKSPCVVDKSSGKYLDYAARRIAWGCYTNSGQTCVRPDFVLVHNDVKDKFIQKFKEVVAEFYSEDPKSTKWFARCINDSAFKRLEALVTEHKSKIVVGGEVDGTQKFISPTAFDFGSDMKAFSEAAVMQDEIFGPLVPICGYSDIEQVVDFVKDLKTGKPLALYAFGTDKKFIKTMRYRTTSGGMSINDSFIHLGNHELPFGGVGNSGMGNYHGKYSYACFTHEKAVCEKTPLIEDLPGIKHVLSLRYPPYVGWKHIAIRQLFNPVGAKLLHYAQSPTATTLMKLLVVYTVLKFFGFKVTRE